MTTWYAQGAGSWGSAGWNDAPDGSGDSGTPVDGDTMELHGQSISIDGLVQLDGTIQDTLVGGGELTLQAGGCFGANGGTLTVEATAPFNLSGSGVICSAQPSGTVTFNSTCTLNGGFGNILSFVGSAVAGVGYTVPDPSVVIVGTNYGAAGTQYSGAYVGPTVDQVQDGVTFGNAGGLTGTYTGVDAPTAAEIATAVWQDTTSGDFTVSGSPGQLLFGNLDAAISSAATHTDATTLLSAVNNLNNLSALANFFVPGTLVIPESGSVAYPFAVVVRNSEGAVVDADASPTVAAADIAGDSLGGRLSAITHVSTGVYTGTYTVQSTDTLTELSFAATCAVSSSARRADARCLLAPVEQLTAIAAILTQVNKLGFDGSSNVKSAPQSAVTLPANPPAGFLAAASFGTAPAWYTAPASAADVAAAVGSRTITIPSAGAPPATPSADEVAAYLYAAKMFDAHADNNAAARDIRNASGDVLCVATIAFAGGVYSQGAMGAPS